LDGGPRFLTYNPGFGFISVNPTALQLRVCSNVPPPAIHAFNCCSSTRTDLFPTRTNGSIPSCIMRRTCPWLTSSTLAIVGIRNSRGMFSEAIMRRCGLNAKEIGTIIFEAFCFRHRK